DVLIAQIREAGDDVWIAGPQSEEAIVELERATGVAMPPSYRQFLSRFNGFGVMNSFISGIIDGKPLDEGTGWLYGDTQRFRQDFDIPRHLLVIEADEDAPYCLDTSKRGQSGEFPLVCYELNSRLVGSMAPTFGEWFIEWLRLRAESAAEQ